MPFAFMFCNTPNTWVRSFVDEIVVEPAQLGVLDRECPCVTQLPHHSRCIAGLLDAFLAVLVELVALQPNHLSLFVTSAVEGVQ
jgi:hypothetical protein